jgi:hypothetical protein
MDLPTDLTDFFRGLGCYIPIGYACTHPLEGIRESPSTPVAIAQGSGARQGPKLLSDNIPILSPT